MTATAEYLGDVLPPTTRLERWEIHLSYGHIDLLLNRRAAAPEGRARSNPQVFREPAKRMGPHDLCFADSNEQLFRHAFGTHVDFEQLLVQGFCPTDGLDTPSSRENISRLWTGAGS